MDGEDFVQEYQVVDALVTARKLAQASRAARLLTHHFPNKAQAHFLVALVAGMMGDAQKMEATTKRAAACPDYNPIIAGDLYRDRILTDLRHHRVPPNVNELLGVIEKLHADDDDRLACLRGVKGRLAYLRGQYFVAVGNATIADKNLTNPQWQANNLLPFLKAQVMYYNKPYRDAVEIWNRINHAVREGFLTKGHLRRARLVFKGGRVGCRLLDLAELAHARLVKRA